MSLILVAIDGSQRSERALDAVAARVRAIPTARVELLYVHEPAIRAGRIPGVQRAEALEALRATRAADVLKNAAERLASAGISAGTRSAPGELYPTIAETARALGASEIVLGVRTPWLARVGAALARRIRPIDVLHVPVTFAS